MVSTVAAPAPRAGGLPAEGGPVRIRQVRPADRPGLAALYERAGVDDLRMRFFVAPGPATLATETYRLCRSRSPRHDAVVAEQSGVLVGVASYERSAPTGRRAEFAVFVDGRWRRRGIGTRLLGRLAAIAEADGVDELVGEVLPGNRRMLGLARDLTPDVRFRAAAGVVEVRLPTHADPDGGGGRRSPRPAGPPAKGRRSRRVRTAGPPDRGPTTLLSQPGQAWNGNGPGRDPSRYERTWQP